MRQVVHRKTNRDKPPASYRLCGHIKGVRRLRVKKTFTLADIVLFITWNWATNAGACEFVAPQYQLQSDTVEWQMSARSGETCRRGVRFRLISNPTIKVIASPEFGSLTLQGPSFSYTAGSDFHDQDLPRSRCRASLDKQAGTRSFTSQYQTSLQQFRPRARAVAHSALLLLCETAG